MNRSITFREALGFWLKLGFISFGGPAGQIAIMHRVLVDEKKWIEEERFLHALNFCVLLPGPEAQKLATYAGWLLHGTRGGLAAGILFVLPGALVMLGLSILYAIGRGIPAVEGALFGIKAAVLVIVVEALIRIGKRALKTRFLVGVAAAAFIGIFFLAIPFPLIVVAAALTGFFITRAPLTTGVEPVPGRWRHAGISIAAGFILWWAPVVLVGLALGAHHVLMDVGLFFSKLAVVSFGALAAITAAVVGVILNLTVWFALHVLFGQVREMQIGPLRWYAFDPLALDLTVAALAALAAVLAFGFKRGLVELVVVMAALGVALRLFF